LRKARRTYATAIDPTLTLDGEDADWHAQACGVLPTVAWLADWKVQISSGSGLIQRRLRLGKIPTTSRKHSISCKSSMPGTDGGWHRLPAAEPIARPH
jgi:hypothetical protein